MPVHSVTISGYQIGARRVRYLLDHLDAYQMARLTMTTGRDHLDRYQLTASSTHNSTDGRVALVARTEWFSDGIRNHLYVNVRGATCESNSACIEGRQQIEDNPDSGMSIMIPEKSAGVPYELTAIYRGDFNSDGRPDLMVVLKNGAALVFEQH